MVISVLYLAIIAIFVFVCIVKASQDAQLKVLYFKMLSTIVLKKYYNMPQTVAIFRRENGPLASTATDALEKGYVSFWSMISARLILLISHMLLTRKMNQFGKRNGIDFHR